MVIRDIFGQQDDLADEDDVIFRCAGSMQRFWSQCLPVSVEERKFIFRQFGGLQGVSVERNGR